MCAAYTQEQIDRFWSKVDKEKSTIFYNGSRCWEWTAGCDSSGYGQMKVNGKQPLAHRISYQLAYGEIPQGLHVLHYCDNPPCCNPEHLFLGTNQDNVDDMNRKGRHADFHGEKNPSRKLTNERVLEIRSQYGENNISTLAKIFQVSRRQIRRIVTGKSWK